MQKLALFRRLGSLGAVGALSSVLTPVVDGRFVPYPFMMTFVVTRRCNSRCKMCSIWQEKNSFELSLEQIGAIFNDNDFSFVRSLVLTGGEPTLRSDLPQLFELVTQAMPHLEHLQLATNGLNTRRTLEHVTQMAETLAAREQSLTRFDVQLSLDGLGEIHDTIRGLPGFFDHVHATLMALHDLQNRCPWVTPRLSCVIMPENLPHLEELHTFAENHRFPIHYNPAVLSGTYYNNLESGEQLAFSPAQQQDVAQFFLRLAKASNGGVRFYYEDMARMVQGDLRSRRCMMGYYGMVLEHDGAVYPCINCEDQSFGNLLNTSFESLWFNARADTVRRHTRSACCPTCTSVCYPWPVNLREMVRNAVERRA